jgi:hypothetical protein
MRCRAVRSSWGYSIPGRQGAASHDNHKLSMSPPFDVLRPKMVRAGMLAFVQHVRDDS